MKVTLTKEVEIDLEVEDLAKLFAAMNAGDQAKFFFEVVREMGTWEPHAREMQKLYMGRELATYNRSSRVWLDEEEALRSYVKEFLRDLATAMDDKHEEAS